MTTYSVVAALMLAASSVGAQGILTVSGSPAPMRVSAAAAGLAPAPVTDNSTTYYILSAPVVGQRITAQLDASMPLGVTLAVRLAAPMMATSAGTVALDTTPREVVSGVGVNIDGTYSITYTLSATVQAGVVPPQTRTVTLTIVAGV